jgi:hypothetical protein
MLCMLPTTGEYPYYRQTYAAELPGVPDLSDSSGGLSNPVFFNFVYYILWKVWQSMQLALSKSAVSTTPNTDHAGQKDEAIMVCRWQRAMCPS